VTILVCPLSKVGELVQSRTPERVVSLADPGRGFPELGSDYAGKHLRLSFHDTYLAVNDDVAPAVEHATALLAFLREWPRRAPLLIHCRAGIGRSTAVAFITACLFNTHAAEHDIALTLRRTSPLARPNLRLVELADAALGRQGRMTRALEETGRGLDWETVERALRANGESVPFELPSVF
jgi:predicted protein tyrosine phosphatase